MRNPRKKEKNPSEEVWRPFFLSLTQTCKILKLLGRPKFQICSRAEILEAGGQKFSVIARLKLEGKKRLLKFAESSWKAELVEGEGLFVRSKVLVCLNLI